MTLPLLIITHVNKGINGTLYSDITAVIFTLYFLRLSNQVQGTPRNNNMIL